MPVTATTQETKAGGCHIWGQPEQFRSCLEIKDKKDEGVISGVKLFLSTCEAPSSILSTGRKQ